VLGYSPASVRTSREAHGFLNVVLWSPSAL